MGKFLLTLLSLSLGGGLSALLLAALPRLKRVRIDAGWRRIVWILLFARLAVPASLGTPSVIRLPLPRGWEASEGAAPTEPSDNTENAKPPASTGALPNGVSPPAGTGDAEDKRDRAGVLYPAVILLVWAAGAVGTGLWLISRHLRFVRFLRRWAAPVEDPAVLMCFELAARKLGLWRRPRLLRCPGLRAPMLAGIFRGVLLLPETPLEGAELRFTLLHELSHCRRHDLLFRALALWVNVLHWFNPLMWAAVGWAERDMELSCDDVVLGLLTPEEYADYGRTLFTLSAGEK